MSKSHANSRAALKPEYYSALDGFRGLLAVFVAIYHTIWISHPQEWRFFGNGPVIIDLFFAFSGFLMWRLYTDRLETTTQARAFIKRRFARLYPLHVFMLFVFVAYALVRLLAHKFGVSEQGVGEVLPFQAGSSEGFLAVFQHLTMTNAMGFSDDLTFNPPSWTVGAEFYTYFIFAAMMMWFRPKKLIDFSIIALFIALIYGVLSGVKPNMNINHDYGFWRCVAGFYTGILAAVSFPTIRAHIKKMSDLAATALEVFTLGVCILFVIYCSGKAQFFVAPVIFTFVIVFASGKGAVSNFMSQRIFQYLAKISYSVYLVHVIIAFAFAIVMERLLGGLPTKWTADLWLYIYLCVVLAVSHCTYHLIEVPGGRLIRNWNKPKKQVAKTS